RDSSTAAQPTDHTEPVTSSCTGVARVAPTKSAPPKRRQRSGIATSLADDPLGDAAAPVEASPKLIRGRRTPGERWGPPDDFTAASYMLATYSQLTRWSTKALR